MQDHTLEYIRRNVINSRAAALLIGPQATHELGCLYQTLGELKHKGLIKINKSEVQFWTMFLRLLKGEDFPKTSLERGGLVDLTESSLRNFNGEYSLFLPDVDRMFYKYDIKKKGLMGASLRRIWSDARIKLAIFGSVKDENSTAYKNTFDCYEYPFWINNWLPIRLE